MTGKALRDRLSLPFFTAAGILLVLTCGPAPECVRGESPSPCRSALEEGKVDLENGRYDTALVNLHKALTLCAEGSPCPEKDRVLALSYKYLGNIHYLLHDNASARHSYLLAEPLIKGLDEPVELAKMYRNLGNMALEQGEDGRAREYYTDAVAMDRTAGEKREEARDLVNLGHVELRRGIVERNPECFKKAKVFYLQALNLGLVDQARLYLGLCDYHLGRNEGPRRYEEALKHLQEADRAAGAAKETLNRARACYYRGLVLRELSRFDEALAALKDAVSLLEEQRGFLLSERSRARFWEDKAGVYEAIIDLLVTEKKDFQDAWVFAERIKARAFLDMVGTKEVNAKYTGDDRKVTELIQRDRELLGQLIQAGAQSGGSEAPGMSEKARSLLVRYEENLAELKEAVPDYASLRSAGVMDFHGLVSLLKEDHASLLEYLIGPSAFYMWVINPDGSIACAKGSVATPDLQKTIRTAITGVEPRTSDERRRFQEAPHDLYRAIFLPLRDKIQEKRVYIVNHGLLHHYPLQALIVQKDPLDATNLHPNPRYLIEEGYRFSYLPSASILQFIHRGREGAVKPLVIGNPQYARETLPNLEGAEREACEIAETIFHTQPRLGGEATESWVKAHIGEYHTVLFATHGELVSDDPMFSTLHLSRDSENDGFLTVAEIFNLKMDAGLVVLSACETGKVGNMGNAGGAGGRRKEGSTAFSQGDDVIGIARAFLYAGAESILSTLWTVKDESNYQLNLSFHRNVFLEKQDRAEALANAELAMIRDAREKGDAYVYPKYWAPFVLMGRF